nr:small, acid-soluble spore protein, alpha/beta type [Sedimentibacter sp.]
MSRNKLIVPEAQQAINNLKMEISNELGIPTLNMNATAMYPAIVNGLSVREMVRMGENMLVQNNATPSDNDIF